MATEQSILFSWADVDELPDLRRLALVLEALPDEASQLEKKRGRGRDDYPVRVACDGRRASARAVTGPQP